MLAGIVASMVFLSCKDNFNEQDFMRMQAKLKRSADSAALAQKNAAAAAFVAAQVTALNTAGQLLAFTVQVQEDRAPLAGVTVSLANTSGATAISSATTDANGNAVFLNASIGVVTVTISKTGYATAEAIINLGGITMGTNYEIITVTGPNGQNVQQIVPKKLSVAAVIPIFATTGTTSTATIKGNVKIETDLTNTTFEIPQNVTLTAGFTGAAGTAPAGSFTATGNNGAQASTYNFAAGSNGGFGVGAVNTTTGAYSITVPASSVGSGLQLLITAPTVTANQTMWINYTGNVAPATITPVKRTDIPGTFNLVTGATSSIPNVAGASVTFNTPPAAGAGFDFTYTVVPRTIGDFNISAFQTISSSATTTYSLSHGAGYTAAPTITVSGTGTTATAKASMRFYATGLVITSAGSGYTPNATGTINMYYTDAAGDQLAGGVASISVSTNASGVLQSIVVPNTGTGYNANNPAITNFNGILGYKFKVNGLGVPTTAAVLTGTFVSDVNAVQTGSGTTTYSAAPTFTFTGGGATTQAALSILEFKTQYYVTPNNAGVTSPYKVGPQNIELVYPNTTYTTSTTGSTLDFENGNGTFEGNFPILGSAFATDGTNIVSQVPGYKYRTPTLTAAAPSILITNTLVEQAAGTIYFVGNTITDINVTNTGSGYNAPVTATVTLPTGAPGSGAAFTLTGQSFSTGTKMYSWGGGVSTTSGSGYLANLNQQSSPISPTGSLNVAAKPGQVYVVNINYGTGLRSDNIYN